MPELPDVEGFRRTFARHAAGKKLRAIHGIDPWMLRGTSPQALGRALAGRTFEKPRRHGKLLICSADGPALLLHFGMTGALVWGGESHRHDRLVLELENGALRLRDLRRLGTIRLARDEQELERAVGPLGPDWLEVTREQFEELLGERRGMVKAVLLDQKLAAGLGNLTADEALWQARIDPRRPVSSFDRGEHAALFRAIQKVLHDSIPHGLVPAKQSWLTGARDRRNGACPRCRARLERVKVGGRTSVFCPREQK